MNVFWLRLHTEMVKSFLCLILLCGLATVIASEVHYIIRPSQSQSNVACMDNELTLSQFISSSSDYLTDDTRLIFSPGNYRLKSGLIVENVHSFSMFAWSTPSSKAVITCGQSARFEFRNISIATVSGLEFVGCFENYVRSVGLFQLENSGFLGNNSQGIVGGTVLSIEKSAAVLDRVAFVSVVDELLTTQQVIKLMYLYHCSESARVFSTLDRTAGISIMKSNISITQSRFEGNNVGLIGGVIYYDESGSDITIVNTTFINNNASNLYAAYVCRCYNDCNSVASGIVYANGNGSTVKIYDCKFFQNFGTLLFGDSQDVFIIHTEFSHNKYLAAIYVTCANLTVSHSTFSNNNGLVLIGALNNGLITSIDHSKFINNTGSMLTTAGGSGMSISHSEFFFNEGGLRTYDGVITNIDHCKFINNTASLILNAVNTSMISVARSEFVDNTVNAVLYLDGLVTTVGLSEFINNRADYAVVNIPYYTSVKITDNVFHDNSAAYYNVFFSSRCRSDLSLSLGSSRCIPCSENWRRDLIGIVVAAFIAGIALIIFMLALNMTVAVGTLNGILFYANIVAANADTYFFPFKTPNFVTVFISWFNLDIGFDACFNDQSTLNDNVHKALLQLAFPAYVIILVFVVIVASECSSKFAKIISKGNPVAVLATMILLSYAKFFNAILASFSLLYLQAANGSHKVDDRGLKLNFAQKGQAPILVERSDPGITAADYFFLAFSVLTLLLGVIFTVLVFSWQWLLRYQDKIIFKWVRYQKLHLFLEPYHAPYAAKYRYWTGLLLLVRALLCLIPALNVSLDPHADLLAVIFIVGGLILLKGVNAKRIYNNWPLDVMETAIYFNLVAFSALTWYNLDFRGNQVTVAYTSVMIIFILLLGVIIFHVFRYTRLYKLSFVEKAFKWTSSKLLDKKPKQKPPNDAPEELDGYRLERSAAGDQELPTITYSVVEINQPTQNQEEKYTA